MSSRSTIGIPPPLAYPVPLPSAPRRDRLAWRLLLPGTLLVATLSACDSSQLLGTDREEVPASLEIATPVLPGSGELLVGESVLLTAEVRDRDGRVLGGADIQWSSSDTRVATVDGEGGVTGVGPGSAIIRATYRGVSGTLDMAVLSLVSLELTPTWAELEVGGGLQLTATTMTSDGAPLDPSRLRWFSSRPAVVSVDGGLLTARAGGLAIVAVEAGGLRAESTIQVLGGGGGGRGSAKTVKFFVSGSSGFDQWTRSPSPEQQEWMREHYFRMLTWSPYFDSRLSWYPNAWVYRNAYAIFPGSDLLTEHPDWVLRDAAGNALYIPWGCSGGTCPQYAADFGNPRYREWWIEELSRTLDAGYRGVFVDDVNMLWRVGDGNGDTVLPLDPRTGAEMTFDDWRRYMAEFMEEVRMAFPDREIAHNLIWYSDSTNPYVQRQMRAADYANLERGATDSGIRGGDGRFGYETFLSYIDLVHEMGGSVVLHDDDSDTEAEWMYELASYLLIKADDDMVAADGDRSRINPDNFWEGYLIDFGEPLGGRYVTDGLFRRDYQCGTVVLNQPDQPARTMELGATFEVVGGAGQRVSSVTLDGYRAVVLKRENCTP